MNVYDFDGTIYKGDSSADFWIFCVRKNPALLRFFRRQFAAALRFALRKIPRGKFKEEFFCFLRGIGDAGSLAETFWRTGLRRIRPWYLRQKRGDDIIVSAGPEFLLSPAARTLGVRLVATRMDAASGKILGGNCRGEEKAARFHEFLESGGAAGSDGVIENFYSDTQSDEPLARIAKNSFLLKRGRTVKWRP